MSTQVLDSRLSASENHTEELRISFKDVLRQLQALNTTDQGKENKDTPAALILYMTHILLFLIIYSCLIDGLMGFTPHLL